MLLSDWSDEDPHQIYTKLKKMSDYYNFSERTLLDTTADIKDKGISNTWRSRKMWNEMRMSDADISDVTAYTYTYLMNGSTPDDNWTGLFKNGERIRLRFINGSAMTFFDVRIPGLKMTVVAADGQYVKPVTVDEFRIGIAETYDVIIEPDNDSAYTVFAQSIDRSGYTRATLTSDPDIFSVVPELDPAPTLTHEDMGMGGMAMANMNTKQSMDHTKMDMSAPVMDHSMMDHSTMDHSAMPMANTVTHSTTEYGPHVDERANNPQYRLGDPGVGLRNNGRRVLTYADLRNLYNTANDPEPTREINLHLTGNMSRYMWSINGVKYSEAKPIELNYGERVRINFVNDTMMNHPMHLHGMWSDLETGDNDYMPRKHTIIVQPGSRISYRVTADAKGKWAFHCHLLYHMGGMFREVHVS
jgi:CopA family copper-resistance protein